MKNKQLPVYYKCNMTKKQHIIAYILLSVVATAIVFLFYHLVFISIILGFVIGYFLEKIYAQSTIKKRQKKLLLQFRDFLENMSVAAQTKNATNALEAARDDLKNVYNEDADIVIEIENIINQYKNGGELLKDLFADFAERSQLDDIKSFATVYGVIEGKSDNYAAIIQSTYDIIGDKIEISEEIETSITSSKSETYTMLVMPIIIVVALSALGSGFMDTLFTSWTGHIVATVALLLFLLSFVIAIKATDVEF